MGARLWHRIWVTFTSGLISFIAFSPQIWIIWPWYGSTLSVDMLKLLVPFNLLVFMIFWNYRLCIITPPGGVPSGWRPNMTALENMEVKKGSHGPRYCKTCEHYKPPRAHHCRQCKTCVVKLDHHCPWIANCVGFYNQGHFIRFLLYVVMATSYHLGMLGFRVAALTRDYYYEPTVTDVLMLVFNFAACVPVWLCVGMFSMYHLYLASGNSTTIEGWEKDKVATLVRRGKIREIKYPYNIGFLDNIKSVLGPNPLLWLWPQPMRGDGLSYPVNPEAGDSHVQYLWPPQDPTRLPNPPPSYATSSAFVYGNDGFNPSLRPSSGMVRSRHSDGPPIGEAGHEQDDQYSHEGTNSSYSRSSSPEQYMSDYDDDDEPLGVRRGEEYDPSRVRRGSEGFEVRPVQPWLRMEDMGDGDGAGHGHAPTANDTGVR
ncbi:Palmitoyltransferase PFA4 [Dioszegia hungarica]|uniref:Palmitoyltransferase PFA4 n=1 Tax=Dioszegia hungarica TaxID=4972 RepID=A0AA38LXE9_9TREE|nr:Palmitoyltransferase PFA4 [Dioszegia hungarica]KAI9637964.1 Palmitoyltransferase PFA4 [Dioszegia hungarica]